MAVQQLTLPGELVKKHNNLVRSKLRIDNAQAARVLASLIACIRSDDTEFSGTYSLPIKNVMNDDSGRGYKNIKDTCKELLYSHAEIEKIDTENPNGHPKLSLIPFFREIDYSRGIVKAQFNQNMSELLLQLRDFFTEYNLIEYLSLPSIYSQRLFEILKSWSSLPEKVYSMVELHELLNTPPSFRANFKAFRTRVLEKAHKDIHAKTTFRFEWDPVKSGHSVESIRFTFGPGRRAIAVEEQQKAKEAKKKRLETQRFLCAAECAKGKKGDCTAQNNKPIVCKLCVEKGFCDDLRRRGGKPFDPEAGVR